MSFPRPDAESKALFHLVLPADPWIQVKPMFGNLAGFANGYMFAGLFGQQIFVRLPEPERTELLAAEGASVFDPMGGRPMKEYVTFPAAWRTEPERVRAWMARSLQWVTAMPPKAPARKNTSTWRK